MIRSTSSAFVTISAAIFLTTGLSRAAALYDWGDAPDDPQGAYHYATTAANHGANHEFVPGVFLGAGVDTEADGQPQIHALGDDNDGNDDEDGVVFTSPLVPGAEVTLEVTASVRGFLNVWIDIDRDGEWQHPAEAVFVNQELRAGVNLLSFTMPPEAQPGATYARFRFTSEKWTDARPDGPAPDGEVEDYAIQIENGSTDHKMHWVQQPDPGGWDVFGSGTMTLADDFRCTEDGPITRIVFWGSWHGDEIGEIEEVDFAIHSDDRTGEFSKPGEPLWEWRLPGDCLKIGEPERGDQGWFDPAAGKFTEHDHEQFFRYTAEIPADQWFVQQEGTIYWLEIRVRTTEGEWGWKTSRSAHFEDDGVWDDLSAGPAEWGELVDPITKESLDMAFFIASEEQYDWGDAPDQPYPTRSSSNGASHKIVPGMMMGSRIDGESDGQPNDAATGDDNDGHADEDGVVFGAPLAQGQSVPVTVNVTEDGYIYAWIDFNHDGVWSGSETVLNSEYVFPGPNTFSITVPGGATLGETFARFRYSTDFELGPTGPAPDGEVEDYRVTIEEPVEVDWGDAPDDQELGYPTLAASNGASHIIAANPQGIIYCLGDTVDAEADGQESITANGDDLDGTDDEDGVTFLQPLTIGGAAVVEVRASTAGYLNAWIDFTGDRDWTDPGEHVFIDTPLAAGLNSFVIMVPSNAAPGGYAGARFRFTSQPFTELPGLDFRGRAPDGEVEDYMLEIENYAELDWGDAPDGPYPTGILHNGARHRADDPGFCLGNSVDTEANGLSDPNAAGDDSNNQDDEDGVFFYPLIPGQQSAIDVTVGDSVFSGRIDAWIDFDGDGSWEASEKIVDSFVVSHDPEALGPIQISFPVPADASPGITFARVRLSKNGGLAPTGFAPDGEVEDYRVAILPASAHPYDYGDAPFLTMDSDNGARHKTGGALTLHLGAHIDSESDGHPDPLALGDDLDPAGGPDDEDGVEFPYPIIGGNPNAVEINSSGSGEICAWIDLNGDGDWDDPGEHILDSVNVDPGYNVLSFFVPEIPSIVSPNHFARIRLSTRGGLAPTGPAPDGEVEDCLVTVYQTGAFDFGDAPELPYPTRMENLGAAHMIDALFLGMAVDGDIFFWPNPAASGDDDHGIDDEDGVVFDTALVAGCPASVTVVSSGAGILEAWIDFDSDGTWTQVNEFAIPGLSVNPGANSFAFPVPDGTGPSTTYARFRVAHSAVGFDGYAEGGEVEDYRVVIGKRIESALSLDSLSSPGTITLNWPAEPGASHYSVYSSTTLAGNFPADWTLEASDLSATTWTTSFAGPTKFFVVVAFP